MDPSQAPGLAMSLWSSTALMAWEITITLNQEIEFVWSAPWTLPKTLYVTSRYLGLATSVMSSLISEQGHLNAVCDVYNVVFAILYCVISAASDGLLLLRVCAMYGNPGQSTRRGLSLQRVLTALYSSLLLLYLAMSIWNIQAAVGFEPGVENFGCFTVTGVPAWGATVVVVATVIFDFILFFLTMVKIFIISRRGYSGALTSILLRDGCMYFAQMFATSLVCTVFLQTCPPSVQSAALPWYIVLTPISTGRLFLNLKSMGSSETWKQAAAGFGSSDDNGSALPSVQRQDVEI
ncbi:hypothetical protein CALCODRAFT_517929 [Calocera cornea HHB12733]|uniref:DUF6533 domain-containing protein n=1 Tax=Calocera cornea HHB12733 TaxID=1353952 RepID=A0A165FJ81_9BASI|nr:hypothetical protein CALCODRAFT_517929 [Calocera cornea HHB12733]